MTIGQIQDRSQARRLQVEIDYYMQKLTKLYDSLQESFLKGGRRATPFFAEDSLDDDYLTSSSN